jgi:hypothetical protein
MRGQHLEGTLIAVILALVIANLVPPEAIAIMGSAGRRIHLVGRPMKWMPGGNTDLQALVNLRCVPVGIYQFCVLTGQFRQVLPCV